MRNCASGDALNEPKTTPHDDFTYTPAPRPLLWVAMRRNQILTKSVQSLRSYRGRISPFTNLKYRHYNSVCTNVLIYTELNSFRPHSFDPAVIRVPSIISPPKLKFLRLSKYE